MNEPVVYVSTDPDVIAAVDQQRADQAAWMEHVRTTIRTLPWASGQVRMSGAFGPLRVVAVVANDMAAAQADGWKRRHGENEVGPFHGPRGDAARQLLAEIGSVRTAANVIAGLGAPEFVSQREEGIDGREVMSTVRVYRYGGSVHLAYEVEPTGTNTSRLEGGHLGAPDGRWVREPLSAFYAAREAHKAAKAVAS